MPTPVQIQQVRNLIEESLRELIDRDKEILGYPPYNQPIGIGRLNRKLHEVAINHCLAAYLEKRIRLIQELNEHYVDIEYNRYFDDFKRVRTELGLKRVRPDILIHKRMDYEGVLHHYLAIEAKKNQVSNLDTAKVKGLITDPNYLYQFGLTISYCLNLNQISGILYYLGDNGEIAEGLINVLYRNI